MAWKLLSESGWPGPPWSPPAANITEAFCALTPVFKDRLITNKLPIIRKSDSNRFIEVVCVVLDLRITSLTSFDGRKSKTETG
jgi:hypothetical protein